MDDQTLCTARLAMCPLTIDHIGDCLEIDTDPIVMRYLGGPANRWSRALWLAKWITEPRPSRGGLWLVSDWRDSGVYGWCGLFPLPRRSFHEPEVYEIGYRYLPLAWGRGIATEAARRILDHGFRALCHDPIVGVTHPENFASQRVLERIGLRREGERFAYGAILPFFCLKRRIYLSRVDRTTGQR